MKATIMTFNIRYDNPYDGKIAGNAGEISCWKR